MRQGDLTQGPVMKTMLRFAMPMILGNLLQQCYNVADTLIAVSYTHLEVYKRQHMGGAGAPRDA